jgi:O-antigen ligase
MDLFLDLLPWVAFALWFGARAMGGGADWSFTGAEFALLAFAIAVLASALRSEARLPAIALAFRLLSFCLLFLLLLHSLGPRDLAGILLAGLATLAVWALVQRFILIPDTLRALARVPHDAEFARRAGSREVFATFLGPNQFAGFLVLLLPLALGFLLDARRHARAGAALALGLGLPALFFTGSLGGWVSLGAGAAAFGALALTRARRRGTAVAAAAAAGGVLVLLVLFTPLLEALASRSHSMRVRRVYWQAAAKVAAEAPVLGVGPDGFRDRYFQAKSDVPQETTRVHNDYLQLLADAGALGLAAFAAFLAIVLRPALAAAPGPALPPPRAPPWLAPAAAGASFAGAWALSGVFDPAHALGLAAVWLAVRFILSRGAPEAAAPWTRIGAAAGLAAVLVHMTVDFDLYEPGLGAVLFAALALGVLLGPPSAPARLPSGACAGACLALLAVAGPGLFLLVPRALAADQEIEAARAALGLLERSRAPEAETTQRISDALRLSEAAMKHNSLEPEAHVLHARARYHEWDLLRGTSRDPRALAETEALSLLSMENAIALRPRHAPYAHGKAEYHRLFRRFHLEEAARADRRTMALAQASEHLRLALLHQRRAVELYPAYARGRYALARLLEESGEEARNEYREALRLSELAGREIENLDRLKLEPWQRARALKRLDRHAEAQEALAAWLAPLRGTPPDRLRPLRSRPQSLGVPPDELDDLLRPSIEEALDAFSK